MGKKQLIRTIKNNVSIVIQDNRDGSGFIQVNYTSGMFSAISMPIGFDVKKGIKKLFDYESFDQPFEMMKWKPKK